MSKDIHKWTRGRYTLMFDEHTFFVWDNEKEDRMCALEVTKKLNELSEENEQLKEQVQILKKEVRDFLHLCDVCDIQSHLSDECEEVLNDE